MHDAGCTIMENKHIDPESQKLWEDLRRAHDRNPCCRNLIKYLKQTKSTHLNFYQMGFLIWQAEIIYCPQCGEKLFE